MPTTTIILIVDDEAYIAELLSELLMEETDYEVQVAFNGLQALSLIQRQCPSLIITDLMMPFMDGRSLLEALWQEPATERVPVITMSAARHCPEWVRSQQLPFIAKPFEPSELLLAVQQALVGGAVALPE